MANPLIKNFSRGILGYNKDEIDDFLAKIDQFSADEILRYAFKTSFLGYNKMQVDKFLDEIILEKKKHS